MDRHYIFSKIFPKATFDEKKIGYAQSFLMTEIKEYLAYQEYSENEIRPQINFTRNLRKRGLNRHFESEWKIASELLEKQAIRNSDYHFYNFQLQNEQYEFTNQQSRKQPKGLQEASNELTNFFIAQKLKQGRDKMSHQSLISADYQKDFLQNVIDYVEKKDFSDFPAIQIYYESYKTLSDSKDVRHYENFRKILKSNYQNFSKSELKYLYLVAINYCIKQHNAGNSEFKRELFELYKEGIELDIFLTNGFLSRFTYKNMVSIGINLREFEWIEKFIYEYKEKIEEQWRESAFTFNLASMYYQIPNYDKAMQLLQQAEFKDGFFNLNARKMLLKMYFELNEISALESLLDSFSRYLSRHKDLGYHKDLHLNLIRQVRKLLQIPKYDKDAKLTFRKEIEMMEGLIEKKWLLEQCA